MYVNRNSRRENGSGRTQDFLPKADIAVKNYSNEKEKWIRSKECTLINLGLKINNENKKKTYNLEGILLIIQSWRNIVVKAKIQNWLRIGENSVDKVCPQSGHKVWIYCHKNKESIMANSLCGVRAVQPRFYFSLFCRSMTFTLERKMPMWFKRNESPRKVEDSKDTASNFK